MRSLFSRHFLIKSCISFVFALLFLPELAAQEAKRSTSAVQVVTPIKIDGVLDESAWNEAPVATRFVQRTPFNGKSATFQTEVRFLYDNSGLYVGAILQDPHPDSIPAQLGLRDATDLNADYFVVILSPFNDGINGFGFKVYVSDVQADLKISSGTTDDDDDYSWDAVWQSKARITDSGWIVEMRIPYSALRFPDVPVQEWGMNCVRDIRRYREASTWNLVDIKVLGFVNQCGILDGIRDIKPPLRLSLTPYLSGYVEKDPGEAKWQFSYNAGADLKYGINQSFTLDMTLIPDFGQVPSDDRIYNFSPFEVRYNERRQFFTEGTELFDKGGIFYSRRVGSTPKFYDDAYVNLDSHEVVDKNPMQTRLINATKVSGRTPGGLGIGVFNGMSANTWAEIRDTASGAERRVLTQGFTNYNMLVLDQNLRNNSYIDILNTNYYLPDKGYAANVTGTEFKFANRSYTYALTGQFFVSQKYFSHTSPDFGYRYDLGFGKITGNFLFQYYQSVEDPNYDCNDMGFNLYNNFFKQSAKFEYNIYEPFWRILDWKNNITFNYNSLYEGLKFSSFNFTVRSFLTDQKHISYGMVFRGQPIAGYDYYEPRVDGWKYKTPAWTDISGMVSTDYRRPFAIDLWLGGGLFATNSTSSATIRFEPRYRITDRIFIEASFGYNMIFNDIGYVLDSIDGNGSAVILFGRRDRQTITNVISGNYMITSAMSINLRARHYWVSAPYLSFFRLQPDGGLIPADYRGNEDLNYNLFNVDLSYIWNFAPGSQLSFMWKHAITTLEQLIINGYFNDFRATITAPASDSFSLRILFYLDALTFTKKRTHPEK